MTALIIAIVAIATIVGCIGIIAYNDIMAIGGMVTDIIVAIAVIIMTIL